MAAGYRRRCARSPWRRSAERWSRSGRASTLPSSSENVTCQPSATSRSRNALVTGRGDDELRRPSRPGAPASRRRRSMTVVVVVPDLGREELDAGVDRDRLVRQGEDEPRAPRLRVEEAVAGLAPDRGARPVMPGGALPTTPDGAWRPGSVGRQIGSSAIPARTMTDDDPGVEAAGPRAERALDGLRPGDERGDGERRPERPPRHAPDRIRADDEERAEPRQRRPAGASRRGGRAGRRPRRPIRRTACRARSAASSAATPDAGGDHRVRREAGGVEPDRRPERREARGERRDDGDEQRLARARGCGPRRPRARPARRRPGRGRSCRGGSPRRATMSGIAQMTRGRLAAQGEEDERRAPAAPSRRAAAGARARPRRRRTRRAPARPRAACPRRGGEPPGTRARTGARRGAPRRSDEPGPAAEPVDGGEDRPGRPIAGRTRARRTPCRSRCRIGGCRAPSRISPPARRWYVRSTLDRFAISAASAGSRIARTAQSRAKLIRGWRTGRRQRREPSRARPRDRPRRSPARSAARAMTRIDADRRADDGHERARRGSRRSRRPDRPTRARRPRAAAARRS